MSVDSDNARIYGSDNDAVFIGDLGATLPTTLAAPHASLVHSGWLGTDGIGFTPSDSVNKFRGLQGQRVVRTKITESGLVFQFQCLESTAQTLRLQHNVKTLVNNTGVVTATLSPSRKVIPKAFVVDVYDDDVTPGVHDRYVIPRGEIGERSEYTLSGTDLTVFTFPVEIIGDFFLISNNPALIEA